LAQKGVRNIWGGKGHQFAIMAENFNLYDAKRAYGNARLEEF
jgi:hypothetical protein